MKPDNAQFLKLPIKDLAKKVVCDGHVYLSLGERKFYLMKPGVFVDPGFLKKHAVSNSVFDFEPTVNGPVKERFKSYFRELKYLQFEKDLRLKCFETVRAFHETFSAKEHFLSFALACYEEFCQLPIEDQLRMHETDMHLFRKALYSAAFSVVIAMSNDFFHYQMIRDFYNLTFAIDEGLCSESYSYFVSEACNKENQLPGSGQKWLKTEKASPGEISVFLEHPEKSYELLKSRNILSFPELAEAVRYQHELADGQGFPRGIKKAQVSSWEAVVVLADSLVEIVSEYTFERDTVGYLLTFQNEKMKDLPVQRTYKKLMLAFEHFKHLQETGS